MLKTFEKLEILIKLYNIRDLVYNAESNCTFGKKGFRYPLLFARVTKKQVGGNGLYLEDVDGSFSITLYPFFPSKPCHIRFFYNFWTLQAAFKVD